jgi:DNA-binding NtrC family response regulator
VAGEHTALRFRLPDLAEITVGSGPGADVLIREERGIAERHLSLFVDDAIGVRALAPGVELGEPSAALEVGRTVDVELGAILRLGGVELRFLALDEAPVVRRVWSRAHVEHRASQLAQAGRPARMVALRIDGQGEAATEGAWAAILERLRPEHLSTQLGGSELGLLLVSLGAEETEALLTTLAEALEPLGARLSAGVVEAPASFDRALERLAPLERRAVGRVAPRDPAMTRVAALIEQLAKSSAHVLILGETGVGKDLAAQTIHQGSERRAQPMVRINCVDAGESFLASPDANLLARAAGGTILLDEVSALGPRAQLSLGHRLEEIAAGRYDVRFLATSNHDLAADVAEGRFRKDLFFRLGQVSITVPPLRERSLDIVPLAEHFLAGAASPRGAPRLARRLSEAARAALKTYAWPGNVRELRNVIERATLLATELLDVADLPPEVAFEATTPASQSPEEIAGASDAGGGEPSAEIASATPSPRPAAAPGGRPLALREEMEALERERILEALERHPTQTEAAKALGVPLRTFLNRLDALGIPRARKSR